MKYLWRLLLVLGVNTVVLWGLHFDDWSGPTALAIYWCENLIHVVLISIRIALHRRLTHKRGHYRGQLGATISSGDGPENEFQTFLSEFLVTGLAFTLAHGVFLIAVLFLIFRTAPDLDNLAWGATLIATAEVGGFLVDAVFLRDRTFAWLKSLAQAAFGRIMVVHLAIIVGMALAAWTGNHNRFFLPFAGFKLLVDVGSVFRSEKRINKSPGWLIRILNRLRPGEDFAAYLAAENRKELQQEAWDEEVMRSVGRRQKRQKRRGAT